ncbi:hypothetical protein NDU88_007182 [Pleurodeles waltl]|uniref:Uncharacterized protein n=1 Tax=Pleurodeles waltl TaxID=8319 RepID=A0AAV7RU60_PLEWA|nr:hypothetical protein NDU88_007182 [Pleurodeles waltl]
MFHDAPTAAGRGRTVALRSDSGPDVLRPPLAVLLPSAGGRPGSGRVLRLRCLPTRVRAVPQTRAGVAAGLGAHRGRPSRAVGPGRAEGVVKPTCVNTECTDAFFNNQRKTTFVALKYPEITY